MESHLSPSAKYPLTGSYRIECTRQLQQQLTFAAIEEVQEEDSAPVIEQPQEEAAATALSAPEEPQGDDIAPAEIQEESPAAAPTIEAIQEEQPDILTDTSQILPHISEITPPTASPETVDLVSLRAHMVESLSNKQLIWIWGKSSYKGELPMATTKYDKQSSLVKYLLSKGKQ